MLTGHSRNSRYPVSFIALLVLGVLSLALIAACGGGGGDSTSSESTSGGSTEAETTTEADSGGGESGEPIDIAVVTDLTGPYAGQSGPTPIEAYVDRINGEGGVDGHEIALEVFDGASAGPATLDAARRAVQAKPDAIVFGSFLSDSAMATLAESGIPVVGFAAFPGWTGHENVFSVVGDITTHNSDAWLHILTEQGIKKIALAGVSPEALKLLRQLAPKSGAEITYFNPGLGTSVDAPTALSVSQEIKDSGAEGVIILGVGGPQIQADLNQLGADIKVVEPSDFGPKVLEDYGDKVEGMIFAHPTAQATVKENPGITQYLEDMEAGGFSENIYLAAAPAMYASTQMLVEALERVGAPFETAKTVADLNELSEFTAEGIVPKASFPEFHEIGTDCLSSSVVENGEWVALKDGDYPFTCSKSGSVSVE